MIYYKEVYLLAIPGLLYFLLLKYLPMAGTYIAFTDFSPMRGIFGSTFVGLKHFQRLFSYPEILGRLLRNTFIISGMRLLIGFPVPIILALMLNEMRNNKLKRVYQTLMYLPHFISLVVIASITFLILNPNRGIINYLIVSAGGQPVHFVLQQEYFRWIVVLQGIWKNAGWGTIIFLAAIVGIDPVLYEAASIDGIGRFGKMWYITLPGIMSTIIVLLILRIGRLINENFQQIFLMLNSLTYEVGDVFETYVFRIGLAGSQVSFAAAIGFFKAIVAMIMVLGANKLARRVGQSGIF